MDIAMAIVDQKARNKTYWICGLTTGKAGNYQRNSAEKQKRRRYVSADRVYYIQSTYPFQ